MEILREQPTAEKPYIIENYPYGFRLRTQIRYWIDTTKNGQRFASQTLNPKTNTWNKPKYSTYSQIVLIGKQEETGYITYIGFSASYRSLEDAEKFFNKYGNYLSEYQLNEYKGILGILKVMDKVTYTIRARRYKDVRTGEIVTSIPLMEMQYFVEIDENNEEINKEKEQKDEKEKNRQINKLAVLSIKIEQQGDINNAIDTFKRC